MVAFHLVTQISATKALIRVDNCFGQKRRECEKELPLNPTVLRIQSDALGDLALYPLQVGGIFKHGPQMRYPV